MTLLLNVSSRQDLRLQQLNILHMNMICMYWSSLQILQITVKPCVRWGLPVKKCQEEEVIQVTCTLTLPHYTNAQASQKEEKDQLPSSLFYPCMVMISHIRSL